MIGEGVSCKWGGQRHVHRQARMAGTQQIKDYDENHRERQMQRQRRRQSQKQGQSQRQKCVHTDQAGRFLVLDHDFLNSVHPLSDHLTSKYGVQEADVPYQCKYEKFLLNQDQPSDHT